MFSFSEFLFYLRNTIYATLCKDDWFYNVLLSKDISCRKFETILTVQTRYSQFYRTSQTGTRRWIKMGRGGIQIDFICRQDPYKRYAIISNKPNFVVGKGFSLREGTTFKKYLFPAEIRCVCAKRRQNVGFNLLNF